jgi:hypothetical protein
VLHIVRKRLRITQQLLVRRIPVIMNTYIQECKDLLALAAWIQTFPEFTSTLYNGTEANDDVERILSILNTSEATT